ncbi:MAG: hypothetical protein EBT33_23555, partial [Betaproteobacteria bacterium]|nr:hypothetical protein [Betaproteobacteria bacterium]
STYFYITNTGYLKFDFAYNGGPQSPVFIADNNWHFVCVTCSSGLIQLYLDGSSTGSALQMNPNINGNNKALGANINNSGLNNFVGTLDDIGIWRRPLTLCEIKKLYHSAAFLISSNNATICTGQSTTLTASGAPNYNWSSGSNTSSTIVSPTITSIYSVTSTYTTGCTETRTFAVNVNPLPTLSIAGTTTLCAGQSINITASGANTYTWSNNSNNSSITISPTISSSYSVSGTSTAGCISASAAISNVTVYALPVITANSGSICNGQNFTISPSGANTYTIQGGTAVVSPSVNSSYSVSGTSTAGCISASAAISNVTVYALPVITANSGSICNGQNFTISPSG